MSTAGEASARIAREVKMKMMMIVKGGNDCKEVCGEVLKVFELLLVVLLVKEKMKEVL